MYSNGRGIPSRADSAQGRWLLRLLVVALFGAHLVAALPIAAVGQTADVTLTGDVSWTSETVIPAGEVWELNPDVDTTITTTANIIVEGVLRMRPSSESVDHLIKFEGIDESAFQGGGMVPLPSDVGLWVVGAGILDAVGSEKVPWSYDWQTEWAGDEVLAAPHTSDDFTGFDR